MAYEQPIIIKKVKKHEHAHHGGAWKIAYADFVTAMMAFFLLLWLISMTTPEQKQGLADYFAPPNVSASTSGSGGVLGGTALDDSDVKKAGSSPLTKQEAPVPPGTTDQGASRAVSSTVVCVPGCHGIAATGGAEPVGRGATDVVRVAVGAGAGAVQAARPTAPATRASAAAARNAWTRNLAIVPPLTRPW